MRRFAKQFEGWLNNGCFKRIGESVRTEMLHSHDIIESENHTEQDGSFSTEKIPRVSRGLWCRHVTRSARHPRPQSRWTIRWRHAFASSHATNYRMMRHTSAFLVGDASWDGAVKYRELYVLIDARTANELIKNRRRKSIEENTGDEN